MSGSVMFMLRLRCKSESTLIRGARPAHGLHISASPFNDLRLGHSESFAVEELWQSSREM